MSLEPLNFTKKLYQYVVDMSLRESPLLIELRRETCTLPEKNLILAPEQTQLIALLIKLIQAKRVIEIGTFTGYTTLAMALALPKTGTVITCDVQDKTTQIAKKYWQKAGVMEKIQLHISPGLSVLDELILQNQSGQFDLGFIDADKKNNHNYFEKILTLLRPGGIILIDNVLYGGRVVDDSIHDATTEAIRHCNELIRKDDRVDMNIIPLGDGFILARKKEN